MFQAVEQLFNFNVGTGEWPRAPSTDPQAEKTTVHCLGVHGNGTKEGSRIWCYSQA